MASWQDMKKRLLGEEKTKSVLGKIEGDWAGKLGESSNLGMGGF